MSMGYIWGPNDVAINLSHNMSYMSDLIICQRLIRQTWHIDVNQTLCLCWDSVEDCAVFQTALLQHHYVLLWTQSCLREVIHFVVLLRQRVVLTICWLSGKWNVLLFLVISVTIPTSHFMCDVTVPFQRQTRDIKPKAVHCRATVEDGGPTVDQFR